MPIRQSPRIRLETRSFTSCGTKMSMKPIMTYDLFHRCETYELAWLTIIINELIF